MTDESDPSSVSAIPASTPPVDADAGAYIKVWAAAPATYYLKAGTIRVRWLALPATTPLKLSADEVRIVGCGGRSNAAIFGILWRCRGPAGPRRTNHSFARVAG
jgi:hypothetical protein